MNISCTDNSHLFGRPVLLENVRYIRGDVTIEYDLGEMRRLNEIAELYEVDLHILFKKEVAQ